MNQKGQIVIILLLVMVMGLTIGLSIVSRSILDVKLSTQSEESSRAFTAAEAGVEVMLEEGVPTGESRSDVVGEGTGYTCTKSDQASDQLTYAFPYRVEKDKSAQFYFASSANVEARSFSGSSIKVVWGNEGTVIDSAPAIEVSLFYKDTGDSSYNVAKFAFDPNQNRANTNHFSLANVGVSQISTPDADVRFQYWVDIDVSPFNTQDGTKFLQIGRFRLLYNSTPAVVGVISNDVSKTFPSQGTLIDCLGEREESGISRRVKVFENHPSLPEVFDYVLFNGNPSSTLGH